MSAKSYFFKRYMNNKKLFNANRCVSCGAIVPEGTWVCAKCWLETATNK